LGWSTLGLRLPLHVYPEALAPGVLPKLLNHNFGKRPLLDRLFVSIEDQSRRKKHADAPMTAPSNTSGGVTIELSGPTVRRGVNCRELRYACVNKERLGEQGEGNCRRYRELCR
jgi:hypothetical protein